MRLITIILACISATVLAQAKDGPITPQITVPAPVRLTMPHPAVLTNGSPQRVLAAERIGPKVAERGRLSAQRLELAREPARKGASLAIAETNWLHRVVGTNDAITKTDSRPKIKAEPLVFQGSNLVEAAKNAQQRSREK